MTAIAVPLAEPGLLTRARWAVSDTLTITRRNLLVWLRVPAYIVFTVIQPVIFVLMFRYVFGGAIQIPGSVPYVDFLIPGIIAQTAAFATFGTAIALAQELQKGVIDRLRSMPMARSAVLAGRLVADTVRMTGDDPDHPRGRATWSGSVSRTASGPPWACSCCPPCSGWRSAASPRTPGWPSATRSRCRRSG